MGDETIKLTADMTEIQKSLDDLTKRFEKSMEKNAKATTKMGAAIDKVTKGARALAGALGITFGITTLTRTLLNAGKDYEDSVNKYIAGSERLRARTGGAGEPGGPNVAIAAGSKMEDIIARTKTVLSSMLDAGLKTLGVVTPQNEADEKEARIIITQIAAKKDEIADLELAGVVTADQRLALERKMAELAQLNGQFANNRLIADKDRDNAARKAYGEAKTAQKAIAFETENAERAAIAATDAMKHEIEGRKNIAALAKTQADYDAKIAAANKAGLTVVAKELEAQKQIAMLKGRIAEHNLTPRERLAERKAAKKFARDEKKTDASEAELDRRAAMMIKGGHKATPGSALDRHMKAKEVRGGEMGMSFTETNKILSDIRDNIGKNKP